MEYASSVWDSSHKLETDALESIQKFGQKMCLKSWNESYNYLLNAAIVRSLKTNTDETM